MECNERFLEYQGNQNVKGSRDAIREAFKVALIDDGDTWMETIQTRNATSHGYDKAMAQEVVNTIINDYMGIFNRFKNEMHSIAQREKDE